MKNLIYAKIIPEQLQKRLCHNAHSVFGSCSLMQEVCSSNSARATNIMSILFPLVWSHETPQEGGGPQRRFWEGDL